METKGKAEPGPREQKDPVTQPVSLLLLQLSVILLSHVPATEDAQSLHLASLVILRRLSLSSLCLHKNSAWVKLPVLP